MTENEKGLRKETFFATARSVLQLYRENPLIYFLIPTLASAGVAEQTSAKLHVCTATLTCLTAKRTYYMNALYVDDTQRSARPLYRGTQIVWYIFYVITALLLFRLLLKLIGANPDAAFTAIIYTLSYPFAAPFLYVVSSTQVSGSVFEWTTLLAILVYWVLAWGIVRLFVMGKPVSRSEANVKLQEQDVA